MEEHKTNDENVYSINLNTLTLIEFYKFRESFNDYLKAVLWLLNTQGIYSFEKELIEQSKSEPRIDQLISDGIAPMAALRTVYPHRFISAGSRPQTPGAPLEEVGFASAWFDLYKDYIITPKDVWYDLFFAYALRQNDLLQLDDFLNYSIENYNSDSSVDFIRFLQLVLRKYGDRLLTPEHIETIKEWILLKEQVPPLIVMGETNPRSKVKRERDDKLTLLNQEQTAILVYCLRKTKIVLSDALLNNKEAGLAFSTLTGYSADTIRQNLSKTELAKTASVKNIEAVEKSLKAVLRFLDEDIKPE